jgi:Tol biopolymer transport system component
MKNLFKTTFYACVFALAGILFQISCSNSDNVSKAATVQSKILYSQYDSVNGYTIWYCNLDGSNPTQIPFTLPTGVIYQNANSNAYVRFSPDGQKILFVVNDSSGSTSTNKIFSCNLDGSDLQLVISPINSEVILIGDVK